MGQSGPVRCTLRGGQRSIRRMVRGHQNPVPDSVDVPPEVLGFFSGAVTLDLDTGALGKCGQTGVVETGLEEQGIGIFELGVPVQVVHLHTIDVVFRQ